MKKTFLKSVVATAVVAAAVALSSVAVFAGTTTYNVSNMTNTGTSIAAGDKLSFSDVDGDTVNITWGGGKGDILSDGSYSGAAPEGVTFTKRIRPTGGGRTVAITLPAGATVDFYVSSTNGSDAKRTGVTYTLTDGTNSMTSEAVDHTDGKNVAKISFTVDAANTYTLSTSTDRLTLFGIVVTTNDGPTVYWPQMSAQTTSATSWLGGEPTNLLTGNTLANGAVNNGGDSSNNKRIRIGSTAHTNSGAETPTIASCGYITFTKTGSFNISIKAASSGSTSSRTFYVGTVSGTAPADEDFVDKATLEVTGNAGTEVSATINADGENTYAIYVKPYDKDGTLSPADNTDIMQVDVLPITAVQSITPEVVLGDPVVVDGQLMVTATISDFTAALYQVDTITLNAALGKDTQAEAVWKANDIKNLKDNGDGTVSFTAAVADPGKDARFQAVAHYAGVDTLTADVDTSAVSNLAKYTAPTAE